MTNDNREGCDQAANDNAAPKLGREVATRQLPRRFYTDAGFEYGEGGYVITLDGRQVKTPKKATLKVPTRPLAKALVEEWRAQVEVVDPEAMPLTRLSNTAIDRVHGREGEIVDEIVRYAESDLLCYRASSPAGLVAMQSAAWDPVLRWAEQTLDAKLRLGEGIVHVAQPGHAIGHVRDAIAKLDAFGLTALHNMTTLTGSCVLALALAHGVLEPQAAWRAAHVDEDWQISQWGEDGEAADRRERRWREFEAAHRFLNLAQSGETAG